MSVVEFAPVDAAIRAAVATQGFMKLVGAEIDRLEPGGAVMSLARRADVLQQHGFFHGGAIAFLVDNTATVAAATLLASPGHAVLTAEYKLNFISPGRGDRIVCEAHVLKPGRRMSVVEAKVYSYEAGEKKLCAAALATISISESRAA